MRTWLTVVRESLRASEDAVKTNPRKTLHKSRPVPTGNISGWYSLRNISCPTLNVQLFLKKKKKLQDFFVVEIEREICQSLLSRPMKEGGKENCKMAGAESIFICNLSKSKIDTCYSHWPFYYHHLLPTLLLENTMITHYGVLRLVPGSCVIVMCDLQVLLNYPPPQSPDEDWACPLLSKRRKMLKAIENPLRKKTKRRWENTPAQDLKIL